MIRERTRISDKFLSVAVKEELEMYKRATTFVRTAALSLRVYRAAGGEAKYINNNRIDLNGWVMRCDGTNFNGWRRNRFVVNWHFDVRGRTLIASPYWATLTGDLTYAPAVPLAEKELGNFSQDLVILHEPNWRRLLSDESTREHFDTVAFQNEAEHAISLYDAKLRKALE